MDEAGVDAAVIHTPFIWYDLGDALGAAERLAVDRRRFLLKAAGLAVAGFGGAHRVALAAPMLAGGGRGRVGCASRGGFRGTYPRSQGADAHRQGEGHAGP